LNKESSFDELGGAVTIGRRRPQLRHAHEPHLQAGRPPELTPRVQKAPTFGVVRLQQRRAVKWRALLFLAAASFIGAVFASGYAIGDDRGGGAPTHALVRTLALRGTSVAPHARARLEVWNARRGNLPMTLRVVDLPKLPPHTYYEVDLVRGGKLWGSCGSFRIARPSRAVTLTLNAPFALRKGDSWVVTRQALGREEGVTALRPAHPDEPRLGERPYFRT
jgi:hypothetical protein